MLIIHLNSGKKIKTNISFADFKAGSEDANFGYVRLLRIVDEEDRETPDLNPIEEVDCLVDKDAIDLVDIIE